MPTQNDLSLAVALSTAMPTPIVPDGPSITEAEQIILSRDASVNGATDSKQATPTFNPTANTFADGQSVAITSAGADTIYYSVDGNPPHDLTYSGAISINAPTTLKAIAVKSGKISSATASGLFVISPQATPTFDPVAGSYVGSQDITITSAGADNIYYTTDGTTPTTASTAYTVPVTIAASGTLKALAVKSTRPDSAIGSAAYVIS